MKPTELSLVIIIVGARGNDKTLLLTHFELECEARAYTVKSLRKLKGNPGYQPREKVNTWTNSPARGLWLPPGEDRRVVLEPQLLRMDELVTWDKMYENGTIFFDEIDQVADRQDWASTAAKLLTAGVQVLRHRNLTLVASIQSLEWLNARLQWQADVIIHCRDLSHTPWGKTENVLPGCVANTTWIDKSGIMTGYSYAETGQVYPMQFFGRRYWDAYDTHREIDILEQKTKYKIKMPKRVIESTEEIEARQVNHSAIMDTIAYFQYAGKGELVKAAEFWESCDGFGFAGTRAEWGKYMRTLGVASRVSHGLTVYDLTGVVLSV